MKYILLSLVFATGTVSVYSGPDGTNIRESAPVINLKSNLLTPEVPLHATFDESELESIILLLTDLTCRFTPPNPPEITFEDVVPADQGLSPAVPLEALFDDTP